MHRFFLKSVTTYACDMTSREESILNSALAEKIHCMGHCTYCIVHAEESCRPVGQMAHNHAIGLSSMLMDHHNVCEVMAPAGLH